MTLFAITLFAGLLGLLATPAVRFAARRCDLVDRPDHHRKLHGRVTALGGGVAVFVAWVGALAIGALLNPWGSVLSEHMFEVLSLTTSAALLCLVGLCDDKVPMRGRQKLLCQIVAAGALIASGLVVRKLEAFGVRVNLGLLAVPFTLLWLLSTINAMNLIDGMDGLASTTGALICAAVAGMGLYNGADWEVIVALAYLGSVLAFLVYNFPSASIFLGDAGSLVLGLVLGTLTLHAAERGPDTFRPLPALAIWTIPFLDVGMAIIRRKLTGRSIYTTDRGHLHHCLLQHGFSCRGALLLIATAGTITSIGGAMSFVRAEDGVAIATLILVPALFVTTRLFGYAECSLLVRRIAAARGSLFPGSTRRQLPTREFAARLHGDRQWDELWHTLTSLAERCELTAVQLNVNLPSLNEEYHATWEQLQQPHPSHVWDTDLPLIVEGLAMGRIKLSGPARGTSLAACMDEVRVGLQPFELHLRRIVQGQITSSPSRLTHDSEIVQPVSTRKPQNAAGVFAGAPLATVNMPADVA